ncbi:MAG: chorismate synthase [Clostridia bacterium]|nr:chorismate synthase [Clostridia bacterium]
MKNTFGNSIAVTVFGESHGEAIGVVIDGLAPGIPVDNNRIEFELSKRRPSSSIDTPRREPDKFHILSGVFRGKTTGTPLTIIIPNENTKSEDYTYGIARPSHADYAAFCKYHGFEDYRGGGHFSGRITAGIVAVGGILLPMLENMGIKIGTHILKCGDITDSAFSDFEKDIDALKNSNFPTISKDCGAKITEKISETSKKGDSIGGITQTAVIGMKKGVGEPFFDSLESLLSHALFSIGGIKGVEFGKGFDFADALGSECNDEFEIKDGNIGTLTNNNGGINGGISNGMPILFNCAVKPTPSISLTQNTVDFVKSENTEISVKGRHDPAIIRRICPVINSISAIVIADALASRFGTDIFLKGAEKCSLD